ncbi:rod shape-determining protein RodA [Terasakiella sp. A23]|uniref:rod shape-determining protein RodA n=1 Tax=Terasakiella sp. FCG-A23 TaxID=3080561 RepID=UPI00398612C4
MMTRYRLGQDKLTIGRKILELNWGFVFLLMATASVGFAMLYSAAPGDPNVPGSVGSWDPWAKRQLIRFCGGLVIMFVVALTDIRLWLKYSYVLYFIALGLLIGVEVKGSIGMGAQRWISLGFFQLQPSELMKITMVLALARYFHGRSLEEIQSIPYLFVPLFMVAAPSVLILRQPDLGTTLMLILGSGVIFFLAGVRLWKFALVGCSALAAIPVAWQFLHTYQKKRVLTFLNPENDPLGAGYHIMQSKIAFGSGGMTGKGFGQGSQSHLNFLPEKQTDFIFTMLAEEHGLMGGLAVLGLYLLLLIYGYAIAMRSRSQFGRLVALGVTTTFFLYIFINIGMVMGLLPVVGVPLPLISYGGTVMISILFSFGLLLSVSIHRDMTIGRKGEHDDL